MFANNKDADQPAHLRRLISAFIIRVLESIISKLNTSKISIFKLVAVAEETLKTDSVALRPIYPFMYFLVNIYLYLIDCYAEPYKCNGGSISSLRSW